jgi:hypothetical protein
MKEFRIDLKNKKQVKYWRKPIPKNQKRKLSICPKCKQRFYYWQRASEHAEEFEHHGYYGVEKKTQNSEAKK